VVVLGRVEILARRRAVLVEIADPLEERVESARSPAAFLASDCASAKSGESITASGSPASTFSPGARLTRNTRPATGA